MLNLAKAFAGECQARTRYEFIEYGARKGGLVALADIIDKIAYNEFNHSRMLYTFIQSSTEEAIENIEITGGYPFKEKWSLVDNLKFASEAESQEADIIYPHFASVAEDEGFKNIAGLFRNLASVETTHKQIFNDLHQQLSTCTMYKKPQKTSWRCGDCGNEVSAEEAPKQCPLCQANQGTFLIKTQIMI